MATVTSIATGNWSDTSTWDTGTVPVNGDSVIISGGHTVTFNVDQSGFANGLAGLTINGMLIWSGTSSTTLKMNGNITGTGKLIVGHKKPITSGLSLLENYEYVWFVNRPEIPLCMFTTDLTGELIELDSVDEVENTPGSYYADGVTGIYIHYPDGSDPTGKVQYPISIPRPTEGTEYRVYILFNSTGTINVPVIRMYGWYPEREYTQLANDASAGQNQIVLEEDLGLQAGDIIVIGSGTEPLNIIGIAETTKGIYTVSSYDSITKTVTLTVNLQTNRLNEDYVGLLSKPIKIGRTAVNSNGLITTKINNLIFKGVSFFAVPNRYFPPNDVTFDDYPYGWVFDNCSFGNNGYIYSLKDVTSSNCIFTGSTNYGAYTIFGGIITNSIFIAPLYAGIIVSSNLVIDNCIFQNCYGLTNLWGCTVKNSVFKNMDYIGAGGDINYNNCSFEKVGNRLQRFYVNKINMVDCHFKDNLEGYFYQDWGELHNCLFDGKEVFDTSSRNIYQVLESFDHNQIPGNYKAWMKGGKIETDFDGETPLPGRLILSCESADYPVFKDYQVMLPAHRTVTWQALTRKSFTGGTVKIELIDPTNDPLIDSTAQPLASYSLLDTSDTNLPLKLGYKSDTPMQAILRISAQNATGAVEIDTRLIENRVQHGR